MQSSDKGKGMFCLVVRTDDPVSDFNRWDEEQNRMIEELPECSECGQVIQEEEAYYINGEWICPCCMETYKREVMPG